MKRILLCAALLAWSGLCSAVVYKWVDAKGETQYGDRPPDGVKAELVTLLSNHSSSNPNARSEDANRAARPVLPAASGGPPVQADTKKSVEQDVSAAKAKQCADAQERYRKLIEGRRIYKAGKDGEREYLSSQEIDSARLNAKSEVDAVCNSAT